jgi:hypothetical protein
VASSAKGIAFIDFPDNGDKGMMRRFAPQYDINYRRIPVN